MDSGKPPRRPAKRPMRLQDIAKKAGVSAATVSLVLNDKGVISDETRTRIKKYIAQSSYIYDKRAAALRTRRTYDVGVLLQDISNPYFAEMIAGLSEYLSDTRYLYFLANADESQERQERLIQSIMEAGMDGAALYLALDTPPHVLDKLKEWGKPMVLLYRHFGRSDFDSIVTDHYHGGLIAAEALIKAGHKRIAFAGGSQLSNNRKLRYQGYIDAMGAAGLDADEKYNYYSKGYTKRDGIDVAQKILQSRPRPTAVMFFTDALALGALSVFIRQGVEPARDIAMIGFDNIRESEMSNPALCTVSADPPGMGKKIAKTLLERIEKPDGPVKMLKEKPELVIRETSGCKGLF